ncbi:MAG: sigma-70 family RNA polymerase sigma factor [Proteobacteria bacterium]|nr:MAG: sigma-70 family RNA polymerase sigma factor [Pseudomonadota bacterium]
MVSTFNQIYAENLAIVSHVVKKFATLQNDAEDIVHDVFIKLHQSQKLNEISNVRAYLIVAARNTCLTRLESRRSQKTHLTDESGGRTHDRIWESDVGHELNIEIIRRLITQVERDIPGGPEFAMFYRDGLSLKEISDRTGEPMGTISARVARMRGKVKRMAKDRLEDFH